MPDPVTLDDNSSIHATSIGCVPICIRANGHWNNVVLQDVLFIPELNRNLLSVTHITQHGADVRFTREKCQLYNQTGQLTCSGQLQGKLYIMNMHTIISETARIVHIEAFPVEGEDFSDTAETALVAYSSASIAKVNTWHRCLAHLNVDSVMCMVRKGMVKGMEISGSATTTTPCEPCLKGKQMCTEIQKITETHADVVLGRVFSNVCGKLATCSHHNYKYFVTFMDDKSHKVFIVGLHQKSEAACHLKAFIACTEVKTGQCLKILHSDGGGEYTGGELAKYLEERGIQHEITTPDTPQHNGVAEHMNRTLLDKVRAMLLNAGLPESYWYNVLEYMAHLHNIVPTRALGDVTPEEAWSGNKPDVSWLCIFGSRAFVHIPDAQQGKLATKSLVCTFLGHAQNCKAYHLVHRPTHRFLESCDIIFNEGGVTPQTLFECVDTLEHQLSTYPEQSGGAEQRE
jgi:GAG-pre-integrase domain